MLSARSSAICLSMRRFWLSKPSIAASIIPCVSCALASFCHEDVCRCNTTMYRLLRRLCRGESPRHRGQCDHFEVRVSVLLYALFGAAAIGGPYQADDAGVLVVSRECRIADSDLRQVRHKFCESSARFERWLHGDFASGNPERFPPPTANATNF